MAKLTGTTPNEILIELDALSRDFMRGFGVLQLHRPRFTKLMAPDLYVEFDNMPAAHSAAEHIATLEKLLELPEKPSWIVEVFNSSGQVNESCDEGTVFMTVAVSGMPPFLEQKRESIVSMKWARMKGKWLLYEQTIMRGPGEADR